MFSRRVQVSTPPDAGGERLCDAGSRGLSKRPSRSSASHTGASGCAYRPMRPKPCSANEKASSRPSYLSGLASRPTSRRRPSSAPRSRYTCATRSCASSSRTTTDIRRRSGRSVHRRPLGRRAAGPAAATGTPSAPSQPADVRRHRRERARVRVLKREEPASHAAATRGSRPSRGGRGGRLAGDAHHLEVAPPDPLRPARPERLHAASFAAKRRVARNAARRQASQTRLLAGGETRSRSARPCSPRARAGCADVADVDAQPGSCQHAPQVASACRRAASAARRRPSAARRGVARDGVVDEVRKERVGRQPRWTSDPDRRRPRRRGAPSASATTRRDARGARREPSRPAGRRAKERLQVRLARALDLHVDAGDRRARGGDGRAWRSEGMSSIGSIGTASTASGQGFDRHEICRRARPVSSRARPSAWSTMPSTSAAVSVGSPTMT
jgi:hypothetical protein